MDDLLQPGASAPALSLPAANLGRHISLADWSGQPRVVLLLPTVPSEETLTQLAKFQENLAAFSQQGAAVVVISPADADSLGGLATRYAIEFPLLSDPAGLVLKEYGAGEERATPCAYLVDESGTVCAVYEPARYPNLPNPAILNRAIRKLSDVPRPAPVGPADWRQGSDGAPVVLVEYSDYECTHCRETHQVLDEVLPAFAGQVLLVHRHLPLRHMHPQAQLAAEAAEAAGAQGQFWPMHDRLFAARDALAREWLIAYAQELGLDVERFAAELDNHHYQEAVGEDFSEAVRNHIKLPPSLFVNGILFEGPHSRGALAARITGLLRGKPD